MKKENEIIKKWEVSVPIFKHRSIIRQLGLAIGIPFSLVFGFVFIFAGFSNYMLYALILVGLLFLLTYLFILVFWKGKYEVAYHLSNKGIRCYTQKKQARVNKTVNTLSVIFGLLSAKPGLAGAGMLAQSRQDEFISWKDIRKIKENKRANTIMIKGNFLQNMALFCDESNYNEVMDIISGKTEIK